MKAGATLAARFAPDSADFAPGLLAITESPMPRMPRAIFYTVAVLFAVTLAWALLAKVDIVAVAEGKLVPASYTKIVQPAEGGVVTDILVKDGDAVQAGQVLLRLDTTLASADSRSLAHDVALKRLVLRRVDAALAGQVLAPQASDDPVLFSQVLAQAQAHRQAYLDSLAQEQAVRSRVAAELGAANETLAKLKAVLPSYQQSAQAHGKLVAEGYFSPIAGNEKEREAIEKSQELKAQSATVQSLHASLAAQDQRLAALTSSYRSQLLIERTEALGLLGKLEQDGKKLSYRAGLLELKAPQAGIVKDVLPSSAGAVVQPGLVLLTLVPRGEELLAEVQVKNEDVGFVRAGQAVKVKLAAYPFQKYGLIEGRVQTLAADAQGNQQVNSQQQNSQAAAQGYKALVKLETQHLPSITGSPADHKAIEPGMQVLAEIHQGRRTVMEYLLSPVQKVAEEAGRER